MVDCEFGDEDDNIMVLAHIGSLSNLVNLQINISNSRLLLSHDQLYLPKLERFVLIFTSIEDKILNFEDIEKDCSLYNKVALISFEETVPINVSFCQF